MQAHRIRWHWGIQYAAHTMGVVERMVGIVKRCLRKAFKAPLLASDEFDTLLVEVETTTNNRPLTTVRTTDPLDIRVLRPSDLLGGNLPAAVTEENEEKVDLENAKSSDRPILEDQIQNSENI